MEWSRVLWWAGAVLCLVFLLLSALLVAVTECFFSVAWRFASLQPVVQSGAKQGAVLGWLVLQLASWLAGSGVAGGD